MWYGIKFFTNQNLESVQKVPFTANQRKLEALFFCQYCLLRNLYLRYPGVVRMLIKYTSAKVVALAASISLSLVIQLVKPSGELLIFIVLLKYSWKQVRNL